MSDAFIPSEDLDLISGPFDFDPKWIGLETAKLNDTYFKRNYVESVKVHKHCDGLTIHVIVTMKSKRTHEFKFDVHPHLKMRLTIEQQIQYIKANYEALMERIMDPRDLVTIKVVEWYGIIDGNKTANTTTVFTSPFDICVKFSEKVTQLFDWNNKFVNRIKPIVTYNDGLLANKAIIGFNCTDDPYVAKITIDPNLIIIHSDDIYKFKVQYPIGAFCKLEDDNTYNKHIINPATEFEITLTKQA